MPKKNGKFPRLFVTDLDDTALGGGYEPYARFPDHFSEFLDRLHERGCRWGVNTTWGLDGIWSLVQKSAVRSQAYMMGEVGHRLGEIIGEKIVRVEPYSQNFEREVNEARAKYMFPLMEDLCGRFRHETINFYGHWFDMRVVEEEKDAFLARVLEWKERCKEIDINGWGVCMGATPKNLSKGSSLREVLRLMKLSPDDVVVAGDSMSDAKMMEPSLALHAICPSNAGPAAQAHVRAMDGEVGNDLCSRGVVQAFNALARRRGWEW